jgi:RNA-binding protein YhbY
MINPKCLEFAQRLFKQLKEQFPELEMVNITESAENHEHIWVNILMPDDEEREISVRELASELSMDILLEHGHHITVSAASSEEREADVSNTAIT